MNVVRARMQNVPATLLLKKRKGGEYDSLALSHSPHIQLYTGYKS